MEKFKKILPDIIAVVAFALIAFAYFFPADIEGRILYQHDTSAGRGAGQEALEYYQKTGERTRWTNATFGGMQYLNGKTTLVIWLVYPFDGQTESLIYFSLDKVNIGCVLQ